MVASYVGQLLSDSSSRDLAPLAAGLEHKDKDSINEFSKSLLLKPMYAWIIWHAAPEQNVKHICYE